MRHEIIHEIAQLAVAADGMDNVIRALVESITRGTEAQGCSLLDVTSDDSQPVHRASYGVAEVNLHRGQLLADDALRQVLQGNLLFLWDVAGDPRIINAGRMEREGIVSMVFLPVRDSRGIRGIMQLYFSERKRFDREELDFLEVLAELGGFILEGVETREALAGDAREARHDLAQMKDERRHLLSFLSMVTHDLKSPLVAVQGYLKLLLRKSADRLEDRMVDGIHRSIQRLDGMIELVSSLLDLSRLESEQILSEFKPVFWEEVLGAAVEMAHELAEPKGIMVTTDIRRPLPEVFASEIRLQQLILNLVSNSVRFTPRGGRITIHAHREGDKVTLSVEDEGTGIEPEHLPHIFEEFYKGDPDSPEGTGLGLSICQRIVHLHQGVIWAESPVPQSARGTRVTFSLPTGIVSCLEDGTFPRDGARMAWSDIAGNGKPDQGTGDIVEEHHG